MKQRNRHVRLVLSVSSFFLPTSSFLRRYHCMFVDRVTLYVKGGDGGRGCLSFRREKYVPRGGPDGGDGGDGGSVIVQAVAGTDSLAEVVHRKHWRAEAGGA